MAAVTDSGSPAFGLVQRLVNQVISRDPAVAKKVAAMEGRVIVVEIENSDLAFQLNPGHEGLRIQRCEKGQPADVRIRSTPSQLLKALTARGDSASAEGVAMEGDISFGADLVRSLSGLDPDLEALAARYIGDAGAVQLSRIASRVRSFTTEGVASLRRSSAGYLVEESELLVPQILLEAFLDDVDRVQRDIDRLEARINRLGGKS